MKKDTRLDARQIRILEDYFRRSVDGETMEQIAKSHDINRKTLWSWKETNHGKQLHTEYQKKLSFDTIPIFFRVLAEKVAKGDKDAMNQFAKIHGLYSAEKQEIVSKVEQHNIVQDGLTKDTLGELEALLDTPSIKRVK